MENNEKTRKFTLITTCFAAFITPFISQAVFIAVPDIGVTFQASPATLSWVVSSFVMFAAACLLPLGRLADIVGRKRLFIPALILFTLSSFLCAFAWSIQWLIAFRIVQGISGFTNYVIAVAILTSVYPLEERGKVIGVSAAFTYLGSSVGPVLGGFLTYSFGWPSVFIACGIICLITLVLALQLKGEWVGSPGEVFDWQGSVLFIIGISSLLCGLTFLREHWIYPFFILAGLLSLAAFFRYEKQAKHPLLPVHQFNNNKAFTYPTFAILIGYVSTYGTPFLLSIYLQSVLSYDARIAGLIVLPYAIMMAVLSPFAGLLSDRIPPRTVSSWGMILCLAGLVLFVFISFDSPIYYIIISLLLIGCGFGLFSAPNTNAVMSSVESKFYGMASSSVGVMRYTGMAVGMAVISIVLGSFVGSVELSEASPESLLAGIKTTFGIFSVVAIIGIYVTRKKITNTVDR